MIGNRPYSTVNPVLAVILIVAAVLAYPLTIAARIMADPEPGCRVVYEAGWRSCVVRSHPVVLVNLRGCGKDDGHAYRVEGTNIGGRPASATVCCGTWLKGCTIRSQ